jgi:NADH-ubiquinone oxidoreductase chain 2
VLFLALINFKIFVLQCFFFFFLQLPANDLKQFWAKQMLFLSIITLIFFTSLPSFFVFEQLPANCYSRISAIVLLFCAILTFNPILNIENIGSGIAIYGGLFHITFISQFMDIVLFIIGAFILFA